MAQVDLWLVIGARRWGRVVATELCSLLGSGSSVRWEGDRDEPVPCPSPKTAVALVVNSAYQHAATIKRLLSAGYHVVSEKPLTFSRNESVQLLGLSDELGLQLFSTNTYLFADYLRVFKRDWLEGRRISQIQLTWADATRELRHGQVKSYDSTVPVIFDVLPHIAGIVLATHGEAKLERSELTVRQGGSAVAARFVCGELVIEVDMRRNSTERIRRARFSGGSSEATLDFSAEPGVAWSGRDAPACVDPSWATKPRPIAEMLRSVKAYFEDGRVDDRLDARAALFGNDLIDAVAESYVQQQIAFLAAQLRLRIPECATHFAYAAREAHSIAQRALPFLPPESPLRRLAALPLSGRTTHSDHARSGKSSW